MISVDKRHHHVENNQIVFFFGGEGQCLFAIAGGGDMKAGRVQDTGPFQDLVERSADMRRLVELGQLN